MLKRKSLRVKEFEQFCQAQLLRLLDPNSTKMGLSITAIPIVHVMPAQHAAGKRKPSLSQLEMER